MLCDRERAHSRRVGESTSTHSTGRESGVNDRATIRREQSRILASQCRADFIALLVISLAMLLLLWPLAGSQWLLIWILAVLCTGLFNWWASSDSPPTPGSSPVPGWLRAHTSGVLASALAGVLWGGVIGLLPSSDFPQIGLLLGLHLSYFMIGAALRVPSLSALHGFAGGAAIASVFIVLLRPDLQFAHYLPFALLATAGMIALGHLHNRQLARQIRLRLDAGTRASFHESERNQARAEMLRKNRFLAAASHDLKQPVYAIGMFADLLEIQLKHQDTKGVLGKIQGSITSLSSLFDGILDISRLDANAMENDPKHIMLDPLLMRLQSEYELLALAKGLSLSIDTASGHIAHVDPTLLHRVLMNLVSNAIKFTDKGSIDVSIETAGEQLSIRITDTGCGIASDQMEVIFMEYQQIRTDQDDAGIGRGLGLAIVKRLCHLMGIQLGLRSTPGIGTEFVLLIAGGCPDLLPADELHYGTGARIPLAAQPLKNDTPVTNARLASDLIAELA